MNMLEGMLAIHNLAMQDSSEFCQQAIACFKHFGKVAASLQNPEKVQYVQLGNRFAKHLQV